MIINVAPTVTYRNVTGITPWRNEIINVPPVVTWMRNTRKTPWNNEIDEECNAKFTPGGNKTINFAYVINSWIVTGITPREIAIHILLIVNGVARSHTKNQCDSVLMNDRNKTLPSRMEDNVPWVNIPIADGILMKASE